MKVILEAQHAVGHPYLRGVGYYSVQLIQALLRRRAFEYELTFFDYGREVGSHVRAQQYFGKYNVPIHECNELDYRVASRDESVFAKRTYNSYTNTDGDLYHFMVPVSIPTNLDGKMVLTIHDIIWETFPGIMPPHTTELHKIATERFNRIKPFVIVVSNSVRDDMLKYTSIPEENIAVVYNSYEEQDMYPDPSGASEIVDGDYFLFIGALERKKNIVSIVEAFNAVAARHDGVKLVIAGKEVWDGYCQDVYRAAEASPYRERIILPGYIDTPTKRRLCSGAVGFVFPSFCEGFGIPVLEAMACGCPVITADNTSLPEVGGDAALYVDAHSVEQLAHEMERVLIDDGLRSAMIQKGFTQAKKFSWDKAAEQVEHVYRKVVER